MWLPRHREQFVLFSKAPRGQRLFTKLFKSPLWVGAPPSTRATSSSPKSASRQALHFRNGQHWRLKHCHVSFGLLRPGSVFWWAAMLEGQGGGGGSGLEEDEAVRMRSLFPPWWSPRGLRASAVSHCIQLHSPLCFLCGAQDAFGFY